MHRHPFPECRDFFGKGRPGSSRNLSIPIPATFSPGGSRCAFFCDSLNQLLRESFAACGSSGRHCPWCRSVAPGVCGCAVSAARRIDRNRLHDLQTPGSNVLTPLPRPGGRRPDAGNRLRRNSVPVGSRKPPGRPSGMAAPAIAPAEPPRNHEVDDREIGIEREDNPLADPVRRSADDPPTPARAGSCAL